MSYLLIDDEGTTRDFATNAGLQLLTKEAEGSPLAKFLEEGYADDALRQEIVANPIDGKGGPWRYATALFGQLKGGVTLTNGVEEDTE